MGVYWKIRFQRGSHEKPIYRGELPKKEGKACTVCRFKGGGGGEGGSLIKKNWWLFEGRGWYPNAYCAVKIGKVMFSM